MNENEYAKFKGMAKRVRSREPERRSFWDGYLRGLFRGFVGATMKINELAEMLLCVADDLDRVQMMDGYWIGLDLVKKWDKKKEGGV